MNTNKAKIMMKELMNIHCPNWKFKWNNHKTNYGFCMFKFKTLCLSKPLTEINSEVKMKSTMVHEIAHAILPIGTNHNKIWKKKCIELGGSGEVRSKGNTLKGKYVFKCPNCDKIFNYHRKKIKKIACGKCCKLYNNNKFSEKYVLRLIK